MPSGARDIVDSRIKRKFRNHTGNVPNIRKKVTLVVIGGTRVVVFFK